MKLSKTTSKDGRPTYRFKECINWLIPGDIHAPFQDKKAVARMFDLGIEEGLILNGDFIDYYWLSSWPKTAALTKLAGYSRTREEIMSLVAEIQRRFKHVIFGAGNHEARIETLSRKYPGFDGKWYWMFQDILPKYWHYLDHGYRLVLPQKTFNGLPIVIEHGDKCLYGGVPSAERLVTSYPGQCTIIGHNHRLQQRYKTTWKNGNPTVSMAYTVGHLSDIKLNNYASNPDWQKGWATVSRTGDIALDLYEGGQ